jgi:UDP-N-acetylglucosamine 1-carboxyvinyltransferase
MQPQLAAALCLAEGTSVVTEGVWENRYRYADELRRMGASIQVDGKIAIIEGVERYSPATVSACDLRAGAAMVIAALAADGVSQVENIVYIQRGYEDLVEKLTALGADIRQEPVEDEETVHLSQAN